MDVGCNCYRVCSRLLFALSGLAALLGILLLVFGSTGFFMTLEANNNFVIIGICLLIIALVLIAVAYCKLRSPLNNNFPGSFCDSVTVLTIFAPHTTLCVII